MLPNVERERKVMILAGTNTYGTQEAAEFVTDANRIRDLYNKLGLPKAGKLPDFEALLKVNVRGGVPVEPELIAVRLHKNGPAPQ
jgi:hypothetical protein